MKRKIELILTDEETKKSVKAIVDYDGHIRTKEIHNISLVEDTLNYLNLELDLEINKNKNKK